MVAGGQRLSSRTPVAVIISDYPFVAVGAATAAAMAAGAATRAVAAAAAAACILQSGTALSAVGRECPSQ